MASAGVALILVAALALIVGIGALRFFGATHGVLVALLVVFLIQILVPVFRRFFSGTPVSRELELALLRNDMLMKPVTVKHSSSGESERFKFGLSCMQGWRRSMEDSHTALPALNTVVPDVGVVPNAVATSQDHALFGVFDGHRGSTVANFCGSMLPHFLLGSVGYRGGRLKEGLTEAFVAMDRYLLQHTPHEVSGCTAVALLATRTELYCANAGDSRCVLCRDGRATPLSIDHKPQLPGEMRRIQRAGSFVFRGRVQGVLALSRAIGDFAFKQRAGVAWEEQAVTCVPEVQVVSFDPQRDEFVVLACDGIWDVMTSQEVVTFVRTRLGRGVAPSVVCEQLMDACLASQPMGLGCDNMSVIIVQPKAAASTGKQQ